MSEKKALKAGIGYTIGNILIKGISFISLPLFSRIMETDNFGTFNVFISYNTILFVIIGLALHSSVRNANIVFKDKIDEYVSSITLIYLLNVVIFFGIIFILHEYITTLLDLPFNLLCLLIINSSCSALFTLYNTRISIDYSYKKYLILALFNSVGSVGLSILFICVFFKNNSVLGRILGITITSVFIAIVVLISLYKRSFPKPVKKYWKFGLKYSLPIIPHGISQILLAQFDRIMINSMVSASAAGIYSLAGNLKIILVVISESISTAWTTWFYEQAEKNEITEIRRKAVLFSFLFLGGTVCLFGISPELIMILGGSAYSEGKHVAIPMIADAFVLFLYNIIVPSEYYKEKTVFIMLGTFFAAVLNIVTNYLFIGKYGYIAAAYTTLFSYFCYLLLHIFISRKVFSAFVIPIKYVLLCFFILIISGIYNIVFIDKVLFRYIFVFIVGIITLLKFITTIKKRK